MFDSLEVLKMRALALMLNEGLKSQSLEQMKNEFNSDIDLMMWVESCQKIVTIRDCRNMVDYEFKKEVSEWYCVRSVKHSKNGKEILTLKGGK